MKGNGYSQLHIIAAMHFTSTTKIPHIVEYIYIYIQRDSIYIMFIIRQIETVVSRVSCLGGKIIKRSKEVLSIKNQDYN